MGILSWLVAGFLAGWMSGISIHRGSGDLFVDILFGGFAGLLAGLLAGFSFGLPDPISVFNLSTLMVAFWGSVVTVALAHKIPGHSPV